MQEIKVVPLIGEQRQKLLEKGVWLEVATIAWNLLEAGLAIFAGFVSGSIALLGFGLDSLIETASAAVVGYRLKMELNGARLEAVEQAERVTSKIAGYLLFVLAAYVVFDSVRRLLGLSKHSDESWMGIAVAAAALVVMPLLAKAKLSVAIQLNSKALKADAMESKCCAWFAFTTLVGLALNATFHWWWADSLAALLLVPLMIREGLEAIKNEECGCHKTCGET
jgi:divalent metal cation (Fe/Co/Zn/Cd) transporter